MNEYYEINKNRESTRYDRYNSCDILEDIDTGDRFLSTREIKDIPIKITDIYHTVRSNEVGRLDIIAHVYYKNPLLWWVLAQANDIHDPFSDMEAGTLIRIPSVETLYGNNGILL